MEQGVRTGEDDLTRSFLRVLECYSVDRQVAERAGEIVRTLRATGVTVGLADAVVAATCLGNDLTLVTLDVDDFKRVPGLAIETVS